MKIFVTPPLNRLELSELGDKNFYVLAQLYKNNPKYREYVAKAKKQGRFLICDNGAGDEGEVVGKEELFDENGSIAVWGKVSASGKPFYTFNTEWRGWKAIYDNVYFQNLNKEREEI